MKTNISLTVLVAKAVLSSSFTPDGVKVAQYQFHSSHPNVAPLKAHKAEVFGRREAIKQAVGIAALALTGSKAEALVSFVAINIPIFCQQIKCSQ